MMLTCAPHVDAVATFKGREESSSSGGDDQYHFDKILADKLLPGGTRKWLVLW